jgi:hypothetical protein
MIDIINQSNRRNLIEILLLLCSDEEIQANRRYNQSITNIGRCHLAPVQTLDRESRGVWAHCRKVSVLFVFFNF